MSIWNRITARWKRSEKTPKPNPRKALFEQLAAVAKEEREHKQAVALAKRKQEFVDNYVAVYLATYAAANHDDACMRGEHKRLEHGIEDAHYLAQKAWEDLQELER